VECKSINITPLLTLSSQDYPERSGWCIEIFVFGCDFSCPECSNSTLQSKQPNLGRAVTVEALVSEVLKLSRNNNVKYLTILGGDPLALQNREFILEFCKQLKPHLDICIYTGYDIEEVVKIGFDSFNFIKCGVFDINTYQTPEKTDDYLQFASANQKLYNNAYELLSHAGKYLFEEN